MFRSMMLCACVLFVLLVSVGCGSTEVQSLWEEADELMTEHLPTVKFTANGSFGWDQLEPFGSYSHELTISTAEVLVWEIHYISSGEDSEERLFAAGLYEDRMMKVNKIGKDLQEGNSQDDATLYFFFLKRNEEGERQVYVRIPDLQVEIEKTDDEADDDEANEADDDEANEADDDEATNDDEAEAAHEAAEDAAEAAALSAAAAEAAERLAEENPDDESYAEAAEQARAEANADEATATEAAEAAATAGRPFTPTIDTDE
jgi:hypothetical protein